MATRHDPASGGIMKLVLYCGPNDWSALYADGVLDSFGDHNNVTERIHEILGIEVISSNDFMLGGNHRKDVAQTLDDIEAFVNAPYVSDPAADKAAALRAKARALLAEADELSPTN
jgi:hypothetical protein